MPVIKPKFDGADEIGNGGGRYDGPPPTPGNYKGTVKKMWRTTIGSGDNKGEDQIKVLVEINSGKFKGAGLFRNLQVLKQSAWSLNQFLDSMTDGSEKQREVLRDWFWHKGYEVADEDDKVGQPILKILGGKKGFNPIGKEVGFIVKNGSWNGETRPELDRFVVPLDNSDDTEPDAEDGLIEEKIETAVEEAAEPEPVLESVPAEDDSGDADDPWS